MSFWSRLPLKVRLPLMGVPITVIPVLIMTALGVAQGARTESIAGEETHALVRESLDHLAEGIYQMCDTQQALGQRMLATYLGVAKRALPDGGQLTLGQPAAWKAVDQFTKTSQDINLPQLSVGRLAIPIQQDAGTSVPYVDDVKAQLGSQCTLFQRMNAAGDMMRVATTVVGDDGRRAIGTFIPRTMADGKPNGVLAKVLKGETYLGRAFVVNTWYQAGYEPLRDAAGEIQGMLFVGVPTGGEARVRETMIRATLAKTGRAVVFNSTGAYVISPRGESDGAKLWDAKDTAGRAWAQALIAAAKAAPAGELADFIYTPQTEGGSAGRTMVARVAYFEPWDWAISVEAPDDELRTAEVRISAVSRAGMWWAIVVALLATTASLGIWYLAAWALSRKFGVIAANLHAGATQVLSASSQFARSSQDLSRGATEQAASLEETSAAMQEMGATATQNAENAAQTMEVMVEVDRLMATSGDVLESLVASMDQIQASSDKVARIVKTIDAIALQTNILSLNAAVEAARAGEAGQGFAVVANEVRNLARQAAESAGDTAALVEESGATARGGSVDVARLREVMTRVADAVTRSKALFQEVASASRQQRAGISQVATTVQNMEQVTQATAATAEESAAASEELGAQAEATNALVGQLGTLVEGASKTMAPPAPVVRHLTRRAA